MFFVWMFFVWMFFVWMFFIWMFFVWMFFVSMPLFGCFLLVSPLTSQMSLTFLTWLPRKGKRNYHVKTDCSKRKDARVCVYCGEGAGPDGQKSHDGLGSKLCTKKKVFFRQFRDELIAQGEWTHPVIEVHMVGKHLWWLVTLIWLYPSRLSIHRYYVIMLCRITDITGGGDP